MERTPLFINGTWLKGHGAIVKSINPANEDVIWQAEGADIAEVNLAAQAAATAFNTWSHLPLEARIKYLRRFAYCLGQAKEKFALLISRETGKPLWESLAEVDSMVKKISITETSHAQRCAEISGKVGRYNSVTRFRPVGPLAVLGPSNMPGHLPNGHIIPALMAGNTVVFKPSEITPVTGQEMMSLWQKAELPPGVLNLVQGGGDVGQNLAKQTLIKGILFTGSYSTGSALHQACAGQPEKLLALEMGGNNPLIVWEPQDAQAAAYLTIQSAFLTSGQRCVCARRLIVHGKNKGDRFIKALVKMMEKITTGPYTQSPEPFMGPVISKDAARKLFQAQEQLLKMGALTIVPMERSNHGQAFVTPGLLDITGIESIKDEEIFGPLLLVQRAKNFDHACALANNTEYGLAAGILCDDEALYRKFLDISHAGVVNWNRPLTGASSSAPFGGVGKSGNFRPGALFAPDYCSYPVASLETAELKMPRELTQGIRTNPP